MTSADESCEGRGVVARTSTMERTMNTLRNLAFAALAFMASGCAHKVQLSYLQPAQIEIDPSVQRVLVVDRSRARGSEHVLSAVEGGLTGESYLLDADGAAAALEALEGVLEAGQRFELVSLYVDGREVDTSIWDRRLAARKVRQLCRRAQCDAVIALETFDSDTYTEVERQVDRQERKVQYEAEQQTGVSATFRMYDGRTGAVIDQDRIVVRTHANSSVEDREEEALAELPYGDAVIGAAIAVGEQYGSRVSPHPVWVSRTLYSDGNRTMRQAARAFKWGDRRRAVALWKDVARTGSPKLRAKALYNLAVAAEQNGNLERALRLARKANRTRPKKRIARYIHVLDERLAEAGRLDASIEGRVARAR